MTECSIRLLIFLSFSQWISLDWVNLNNIEELFNPLVSGFTSLDKARQHYIEKGMSARTADSIMHRYVALSEEKGNIYSIMDFYDSKRDASGSNALHNVNSLQNVRLNYISNEELKY